MGFQNSNPLGAQREREEIFRDNLEVRLSKIESRLDDLENKKQQKPKTVEADGNSNA